ncbi:DUF1697 domain-containing protein [Sporolactobacillus shoreicorticis]|uniref:DUF1697 domain-containing protein n=1 Tax=Sporolactobacillus shoreicorticis TaxID=1923877 RepID=A0ABW5S7A7_9BACL|nr:DUF1697 domain-containing protein [Sporolactobacillus shoreicorticis]MCO7124470.1 DUF1697 domain-containing protein [Sporolactobacillus shoreicorticis]
MIYIVLLRGINVGGKNRIKMAELRKALETAEFKNVRTYIQSGNILLESNATEHELKRQIERIIDEQFHLTIHAIVRNKNELETIIQNCPFGEEEIAHAKESAVGECLYVTLLNAVPDPEKVRLFTETDFGADRYQIFDRNVYLLFSRSIRNSKLALRVEKLSPYCTTRNWKTIDKLSVLLNQPK